MNESGPGWEACPEGELSRLGRYLWLRRRAKAASLAAVLLLGAVGVAGAAWLAHSAWNSPPAEPACTPCQEAPPPCDSEAARP
jgi:hypothetical protein